jgi:hypothetical protein
VTLSRYNLRVVRSSARHNLPTTAVLIYIYEVVSKDMDNLSLIRRLPTKRLQSHLLDMSPKATITICLCKIGASSMGCAIAPMVLVVRKKPPSALLRYAPGTVAILMPYHYISFKFLTFVNNGRIPFAISSGIHMHI